MHGNSQAIVSLVSKKSATCRSQDTTKLLLSRKDETSLQATFKDVRGYSSKDKGCGKKDARYAWLGVAGVRIITIPMAIVYLYDYRPQFLVKNTPYFSGLCIMNVEGREVDPGRDWEIR